MVRPQAGVQRLVAPERCALSGDTGLFSDMKNIIGAIYKPDVVMVVNVVKIREIDKLWCLTLISYDKKDNEEVKNNELITQAGIKGQFQEFKYKYLLLNFDDIIEIYEQPKLDKLGSFYQKDKIDNYFNFTKYGNIYFKNNTKSLYIALKNFYRAILNNFPKKLSNILVKKLNKKPEIFESNKVKALDYKTIIGEKDLNKIKELKLILKDNPCQNCPYYEKHLKLSKDIYKQRNKIKSIEEKILEGEKDEIQKKLNNRINLLKDLEYLQEEQNQENDNDRDIGTELYNFSLTLKGKASLEIITNDNIFITELLSSDIFYKDGNILSIEVIVPFLSIFVGNSKRKDLYYIKTLNEKDIKEEMKYILSKFNKIYEVLTKEEEKFNLKESVYNRSFSFCYFDSIYSWILGNNFCDVCKKYNIDEGKLYHIIIRTFYFSEEIVNFYTKLGTEKLVNVFKNIKEKLLKGIMSVESLYIQENVDINNI